MKKLFLHIKYPYTALIIAIMWISMAIIIINLKDYVEILIGATSVCTIYIALRGFRTPKL